VEENEACKQQMAIECEEKHKAKEDARKMQECLEAIEHEEVPCPARYLCDRDMCRDKGDDVDIYDLAKKTLSSLTTNYLDD